MLSFVLIFHFWEQDSYVCCSWINMFCKFCYQICYFVAVVWSFNFLFERTRIATVCGKCIESIMMLSLSWFFYILNRTKSSSTKPFLHVHKTKKESFTLLAAEQINLIMMSKCHSCMKNLELSVGNFFFWKTDSGYQLLSVGKIGSVNLDKFGTLSWHVLHVFHMILFS